MSAKTSRAAPSLRPLRPGDYLTDGKQLVCVLGRSESHTLVEDVADPENELIIPKAELGRWRKVIPDEQ